METSAKETMLPKYIINVPGVNSSTDNKTSFTKIYMTMVGLLYVVGAIIGGVLVVAAAINDLAVRGYIDPQMFIAYAAYLGGPTAVAIGFYAWKSKAENLLKIKHYLEKENVQILNPVDPQVFNTLANI